MASIGGTLGLSGLPTEQLLRDMRTVEERPLTILAQRQDAYKQKFTAYGRINSALSAFLTAAGKVGNANSFGTMKTTSSNEAALTATAAPSSGAVSGSYMVAVEKLAANQSLATQGVASKEQSLGSGGSITLTLGDNTTLTVELDAGEITLEGLRTAINEATVGEGDDEKPLGITATLLNNGDPAAPHQLVISTDATGLAQRITKIEVSGNTPPGSGPSLGDLLNYEEPMGGAGNVTSGTLTQMSQVSAAQDAKLTVNGIAITSGTNTLEGAIEGVTMNLLAPTPADAPLKLSVAQDDSVPKKAIQDFVAAYNSLHNTLGQLTTYNAETDTASALTGDRVARTVQSRVRGIMGDAVDNGGFAALSQLGVKTNVITGVLEIDTEQLDKVLREDPEKVAALFVGENGLAAKLENTIKPMLETDGLVKGAQDGMTKSIEDIEDAGERMRLRIDDTMNRYRAQFVALEGFMAQSNSTSSYLTQQLQMLSNMNSNNRR